MNIDDIIYELAADDGFPRQTVRYCRDFPDIIIGCIPQAVLVMTHVVSGTVRQKIRLSC